MAAPSYQAKRNASHVEPAHPDARTHTTKHLKAVASRTPWSLFITSVCSVEKSFCENVL